MKKLTFKQRRKMLERDVVDGTTPRPYPGKDPLRCLVIVHYWTRGTKGQDKWWSYMGKIRPGVYTDVERFRNSKALDGKIWVYEFDRNGILARGSVAIRKQWGYSASHANASLWAFYHHGSTGLLLLKASARAQIRWRGHVWVVYGSVFGTSYQELVNLRSWFDSHYSVKKRRTPAQWFEGLPQVELDSPKPPEVKKKAVVPKQSYGYPETTRVCLACGRTVTINQNRGLGRCVCGELVSRR